MFKDVVQSISPTALYLGSWNFPNPIIKFLNIKNYHLAIYGLINIVHYPEALRPV